MPLIEIINITLLSFTLGLLALMGISYLIYRYRDLGIKPIRKADQTNKITSPKEFKVLELSVSDQIISRQKKSRYEIVKTLSKEIHSDKKKEAEKFTVVNKNITPKKIHSPKIIHIFHSIPQNQNNIS